MKLTKMRVVYAGPRRTGYDFDLRWTYRAWYAWKQTIGALCGLLIRLLAKARRWSEQP